MADFNLESLEREMAAALNADRRYQRENDAKFRAVNQRVGSYEEFRDIVKASHIKALDREDIRGPRQQPWNPVLTTTKQNQSVDGVGHLCGRGQPTSAQEFVREWRSLKEMSHDQYRLLIHLSRESLPIVLKSEMSGTILGDIIHVLEKHFDTTDGDHVCKILSILSTYPRFSLSIDLLNKAERSSVERLFNKLQSLVLPVDAVSLWELFKVTTPPSLTTPPS